MSEGWEWDVHRRLTFEPWGISGRRVWLLLALRVWYDWFFSRLRWCRPFPPQSILSTGRDSSCWRFEWISTSVSSRDGIYLFLIILHAHSHSDPRRYIMFFKVCLDRFITVFPFGHKLALELVLCKNANLFLPVSYAILGHRLQKISWHRWYRRTSSYWLPHLLFFSGSPAEHLLPCRLEFPDVWLQSADPSDISHLLPYWS